MKKWIFRTVRQQRVGEQINMLQMACLMIESKGAVHCQTGVRAGGER